MNDLDLMVAGAMVSFLAFAGAYIAIRHRANETPVDSFAPIQVDTSPGSSASADHQMHAPAVARPPIDGR